MTNPDPVSPGALEGEEDPQKIATGMTLADISIRNHVFARIRSTSNDRFGR